MRYYILFFLLLISFKGKGQINSFPYLENFDSINIPELPLGWQTTTNRLSTGDFTTISTSAHSGSNAVISTNARIEQHLYTPFIDFSKKYADSITFFERRSASHDADLLIEAILKNNPQQPLILSDTFRNSNTTGYVKRSIKLPDIISGNDSVKIRWRLTGNGTGTAGTLRLDDICIYASYLYDLKVDGLITEPAYPTIGENIQIGGIIKNTGLTPLENTHVEIYLDINLDEIPDLAELLSSHIITETISPGEKIIVWCSLPKITSGAKRIIITCYHPNDQNPQNNSGTFEFYARLNQLTIVINEIMYLPLSGNAEYIELFNTCEDSIDINGWKLTDKINKDTWTEADNIINKSCYIRPEDFIIIANDSSIFNQFTYLSDNDFMVIIRKNSPALNNTGDHIILADDCGKIIDSLYYYPDWHNPYLDDIAGRSLERVNPYLSSNNPNNWCTSANPRGGTPGMENSLYTKFENTDSPVLIKPNPFSPDGDGFEDYTIIQYNFIEKIAFIRASIYDARGRLVRTLVHGNPGGQSGELVWDGYNNDHERVRIGIYIILIEGLTGESNKCETIKSVIVVGTRM